jgi:hypothetical protein
MVQAAVTAADLPAATVLYTLRHSWITTALTSGMGTLDVARLAGTSLLMIEKHYSHLVSDAARIRRRTIAPRECGNAVGTTLPKFAQSRLPLRGGTHHQRNQAVATLQRWQASSDQLRFDDTGDGMRVVVELFKDGVDVF